MVSGGAPKDDHSTGPRYYPVGKLPNRLDRHRRKTPQHIGSAWNRCPCFGSCQIECYPSISAHIAEMCFRSPTGGQHVAIPTLSERQKKLGRITGPQNGE